MQCLIFIYMMNLIVSTAYFPPVNYFVFIEQCDNLFIEACENYNRQSFRNRCEIAGANGKLTMVVPVKKGISAKTHIKDVRIAYDEKWQNNHFRSIESAYRSSPFYEHYIEEFMIFFQKKHIFLFDYNCLILMKCMELLNIIKEIKLTKNHQTGNDGFTDMRNIFHPKKQISQTELIPDLPVYYQVFMDKHGFISNLSILDLLFNLGNSAGDYIRETMQI